MCFYRNFTESKTTRGRPLRWVGGFAVLFLLMLPGSAQAACSTPTGAAGDVIWHATQNAPAYCNDTNWISFPKGTGADWSVFMGAGNDHVCGLRGGRPYCWGFNANGATGLGTTTGNQTTPAAVGVDTDWSFLSGGYMHNCGIRGGALYCWGSNGSGQLGTGATSLSQSSPVQAGAATDWTFAAPGDSHTCGIRGGALYCWGSNGSGRTGLGTTAGTTLAITQVGVATTWTYVGAGGHACGIAAGALYCWGSNGNGRTGLGTTSGSTTTPTQVGAATDWQSVSLESSNTCGIRGGALYCWGANATGQLGQGTTGSAVSTPTQVGSATDWQSVSVGAEYACGIRSGALYCWGLNSYGLTGLGLSAGNTLSPTQVGTDMDWQVVTAGTGYQTCGVRGGSMYCWGSNSNGRTGRGTTSGQTLVPTLVGVCASPSGVTGDIVYNTTSNVLQYCDGSAWYAAGDYGNGGAGCSNPTGVAGAVAYNSTHNVLQYCEGDAWVAVGEFASPWCSGVVVGGYCWYVSALNQSCDAACASQGGVNATGVINYAGSSGTLANCTAVVQALVPGIPAPSNNGAAQAVGCAIANIGGPSGPNPLLDIPVRYNVTPTTTAASYSTMWRVCACNN